MKKKIGFIGLGIMGKPMAQNLISAGYSLKVHDIRPEPMLECEELGATVCSSPAQVSSNMDIVITMLPDSKDVELVTLGPNGVIESCQEGMVFIDTSTIKPETSRKIAIELQKMGVSALDAPVSGGDIGAQTGTLSIMVGGPYKVYKSVLSVLQAMGKTITYIGETGTGQVAKACNQIMTSAQAVAMAELLVFAQKSGAKPEQVLNAIQKGAAQCWALDVRAPMLLSGNRIPGFKASLMYKDLCIVMDTARSCGVPLPATAIIIQLYESMIQLGMHELDSSAVIGVLELLVGESLVEEKL